MPLSGTPVRIFYSDFDSTLGVYVVEPGIEPYICLNSTLEHGDSELRQLVYLSLINFHFELNPVYRLFPLVKAFEDLIRTVEKEQAPPDQKPEIIIIGQAKGRSWFYTSCDKPFTIIRVIGDQREG